MMRKNRMDFLHDEKVKGCYLGILLFLILEMVLFLLTADWSSGSMLFFFSMLVCTAGIVVVLTHYFRSREALYQEATAIMEQFEEGDFSEHLPKNREGSFFALLSKADKLAMSLKGMNEREKESRELISSRISDISHQLKTPLAALLMYNEIMEQEPENLQVSMDFNQKSKAALLRMQQLIQSLLVMTRLDAGSITFEKGQYYIGELVRESIRELLTRAGQEKKKVLVSGDENEMIFCDKKWTAEAVSNIVKNALDHTWAEDEIEISWSNQAGISHIFIKDQGEGIAEEDICHIFKRFYRSKSNTNTGVGLGLPLTKAIIEGQGGTIFVKSRLGEGTTMTLSFLTKL